MNTMASFVLLVTSFVAMATSAEGMFLKRTTGNCDIFEALAQCEEHGTTISCGLISCVVPQIPERCTEEEIERHRIDVKGLNWKKKVICGEEERCDLEGGRQCYHKYPKDWKTEGNPRDECGYQECLVQTLQHCSPEGMMIVLGLKPDIADVSLETLKAARDKACGAAER